MACSSCCTCDKELLDECRAPEFYLDYNSYNPGPTWWPDMDPRVIEETEIDEDSAPRTPPFLDSEAEPRASDPSTLTERFRQANDATGTPDVAQPPSAKTSFGSSGMGDDEKLATVSEPSFIKDVVSFAAMH
eukprot:Selendium_serpulae@DN5833_c1_g1_i4.p1